jgi:hypothetical protein
MHLAYKARGFEKTPLSTVCGTELMRADSLRQSRLESWIMQKESIQRYWTSRERVMWMASRKVFVRFSSGIDFMKFSRESSLSFRKSPVPQQWLRVA